MYLKTGFLNLNSFDTIVKNLRRLIVIIKSIQNILTIKNMFKFDLNFLKKTYCLDNVGN